MRLRRSNTDHDTRKKVKLTSNQARLFWKRTFSSKVMQSFSYVWSVILARFSFSDCSNAVPVYFSSNSSPLGGCWLNAEVMRAFASPSRTENLEESTILSLSFTTESRMEGEDAFVACRFWQPACGISSGTLIFMVRVFFKLTTLTLQNAFGFWGEAIELSWESFCRRSWTWTWPDLGWRMTNACSFGSDSFQCQ